MRRWSADRPSSDWPISTSSNSAGERNGRVPPSTIRRTLSTDRSGCLRPSISVVSLSAKRKWPEPLGLHRIVVAEVGQVAVQPAIVEIDMAGVAGRHQRAFDRCRQQRLAVERNPRADVGGEIAAPDPARLVGLVGATPVGIELVEEDQAGAVRIVREEARRDALRYLVHGGVRICFQAKPSMCCPALCDG